MNPELKDKLKEMFQNSIKLDEPMSRHTTYGIGGAAAVYATPETVAELSSMLQFASEQSIPVFRIGSGSNVLVSDAGIDGFVISLSKTFKELEFHENGRIDCGAGVMTGTLVRQAIGRGFTGMESLIGVPGTVGGALVMNAGAYGTEISNCLQRVYTLTLDGKKKSYDPDELEFSYRDSTFHQMDEIVTKVEFKCEPGDPDRIQELRNKASASRKANQPLRYRSAGSVFKNPPESKPAGYLIDQAGLKGLRCGDAQISEKHANFFVNHGKASSSDMLELINTARQAVADKFGIQLQLEIQLMGFDEDSLQEVHIGQS